MMKYEEGYVGLCLGPKYDCWRSSRREFQRSASGAIIRGITRFCLIAKGFVVDASLAKQAAKDLQSIVGGVPDWMV